MRTLVAFLVLALVAALPLASAGQAHGELASDAPVALAGDVTIAGDGVRVHHHAFRDGSLSGTVYSGYVIDRAVLQVPESEPQLCRQQYHGQREERTVLTADQSKPYEAIAFSLAQGAFGIAYVPEGNKLTNRLGLGETRASDAASAYLGPNPYRYQNQQSSGGASDWWAPAFPTAPFLTVPAGGFNTLGPLTLEVHWGDLQTVQRERERTFRAGVIEETRTINEGPLSPPYNCKVWAIHVLEFHQQVVVASIDQDGVDATNGFWGGGDLEPAFAQGDFIPPTGYWERTRTGDFATARSALRLPATAIAATEMRVELAGGATFERALGSVSIDGRLHEARDQRVRLAGQLNLQPTGSDDGHRMTTRIGNDVQSVYVDGVPGTGLAWRTFAPLAVGVAGGAAALGTAAYVWPTFKFKATQLLLAPLYARLKKEDLLENPLRDDILVAVEQQPGISASELGRRLECGWGTLVYHLTVLERMQLISSAREGRHKRFFVQGRINYSDKSAVGLLANPSAKQVLDAIRAQPGTIQRDLSRSLGLSPGTIAWHVDRLAEAGLVLKEEEGRVVRYYPSQKLLELTRQLAA